MQWNLPPFENRLCVGRVCLRNDACQIFFGICPQIGIVSNNGPARLISTLGRFFVLTNLSVASVGNLKRCGRWNSQLSRAFANFIVSATKNRKVFVSILVGTYEKVLEIRTLFGKVGTSPDFVSGRCLAFAIATPIVISVQRMGIWTSSLTYSFHHNRHSGGCHILFLVNGKEQEHEERHDVSLVVVLPH